MPNLINTDLVQVPGAADLPPGTGMVFRVGGRSIAVFHTGGGCFHAVENTCPHRGGELAEGSLDGATVTCPLHGWRFDLQTGNCLTRPGARVRRYAVRVEGGDVLLEMTAEPAEPARDPRDLFVRFGTMGYLGRFTAREPMVCVRGNRVVVKTTRGIEVGEVLLAEAQEEQAWESQPLAGELLRLMTPEDELLERGLREGQQRAFEACKRLVSERGIPVELVDAEQLLDGETLIFYFLGDPPPQLADINAELARQYERNIEFRQFADRLEAGCGPGCGTDAAPGCGACEDGACGSGSCGASESPN